MCSYLCSDAGRLLIAGLLAAACFLPPPPLPQNAQIALRVLFKPPAPALTFGARR